MRRSRCLMAIKRRSGCPHVVGAGPHTDRCGRLGSYRYPLCETKYPSRASKGVRDGAGRVATSSGAETAGRRRCTSGRGLQG